MNILRLINVHNEEDILEENLQWYIKQNIHVLAVNNASTDKSRKILETHHGQGVIDIIDVETQHFDRKKLFDTIAKEAHKHKPDWIVFADADEFYEPASPHIKDLRELINYADKQGYNIIRFHNMEFWMTEKDEESVQSPIKRIKHYSYFDSNRLKAYKFYEGFNLSEKGGHAPIFPPGIQAKMCDEEGISRHYKFRTLQQAYYKIGRVKPEPGKKFFGFHYHKFNKDKEHFIINPEKLTEYHEDRQWNYKRQFNGNRMTKKELQAYLQVQTEEEVDAFFASRKV